MSERDTFWREDTKSRWSLARGTPPFSIVPSSVAAAYVVRDGSGNEYVLDNDSYLVRNIVTDFGAVGDGTTNNSAAFTAFRTWAQQQTQPVKLVVPPGAYNQGVAWMQGIGRLFVEGGPATFTDNRRVGTSAWQRQTAMHSLRLGAVAQGATVLQVKTVDPGRLPAFMGDPKGNPNRSLGTLMGLVSPGQWVILSALDNQAFGYPTNPQLFEYNRVMAVGADTITLEWPTQNAYPDTYPVYWNGAAIQQATSIANITGRFLPGERVTTSNGHKLVVEQYPSTFQGSANGGKHRSEVHAREHHRQGRCPPAQPLRAHQAVRRWSSLARTAGSAVIATSRPTRAVRRRSTRSIPHGIASRRSGTSPGRASGSELRRPSRAGS